MYFRAYDNWFNAFVADSLGNIINPAISIWLLLNNLFLKICCLFT